MTLNDTPLTEQLQRLETLERRIDSGYVIASGASGTAGIAATGMAMYDYAWLHNGPMTTAGVALAGVLLSAASWCAKKAKQRRARRAALLRRHS
ncbi:hypothetical protein ACFY1P_00930 [Streptomyces sp. NPDC001407]|uniref:hypothetical protein n=1 Tax=unclassified Streptomyces TaxID=2593676 RepID=UPI0033C58909